MSGWGDGGEAAGQDGSGLGEDREGGPGQGKQSGAGGTRPRSSPRAGSGKCPVPESRIQVLVGGCGQREQTRTQTQTQKGQKRTIVPNLPARLVSSRLGWSAATISGRCRHRCSRCIACPGPSRNKSPLAIPPAAHYWRQRFGAIQQKPPVQHDPWPLRMAPKQERRSRAARAAAAAIPRGTHPCSVAGSGSSWSATGSWTASPPAGPGSAARRRQLALGCLQQLMAGLSLSLRCPVLRFGSGDPPPSCPCLLAPKSWKEGVQKQLIMDGNHDTCSRPSSTSVFQSPSPPTIISISRLPLSPSPPSTASFTRHLPPPSQRRAGPLQQLWPLQLEPRPSSPFSRAPLPSGSGSRSTHAHARCHGARCTMRHTHKPCWPLDFLDQPCWPRRQC